MSPGEAVMKLSRIGFRFRLDGAAVKVCFEGEQPPDPAAVAAVASLLTLVKAHKDEVRYFLRSFCPKCGGAVFGIFSGVSCCMACNSGLLADTSKSGNNGKINEGEVPQATPGEKIVRCGPRQLSLIEAEGWIYQEDQEADDPPF